MLICNYTNISFSSANNAITIIDWLSITKQINWKLLKYVYNRILFYLNWRPFYYTFCAENFNYFTHKNYTSWSLFNFARCRLVHLILAFYVELVWLKEGWERYKYIPIHLHNQAVSFVEFYSKLFNITVVA